MPERGRGIETFGQVVGGVVHDVNVLLAVALRNGRALAEMVEAPELDAMLRSIERASALNRKLLEGRAGVSHAPKLDVGKALEELATLLRTIVPRGVAFELDLGRDLPAAEIEQHELERIVTNLVRNALEVVDEGDTIVVSASRAELEPHNDLGVDAGAYVVVGVFDSGPGVSAEHQGRLFVPFFTTKPDGLGLGLSSVDWLVRRRGGAVRVTSRPKASGTWFEAFLPVASDLT